MEIMDLKRNRTALLAIGDTNLRDAGTGQYLLELISQFDLPENVDVYDCGDNAECFDGNILDYNRIVLITAHVHGDAAGEILFTTIASDIEKILKGLPVPIQKTKHHLIKLFEMTISDREVEWILIGIEPKSVGPGQCISDDVIKAAPKALNFINDLLWESAHDKSLI
jgi:hydrogenase maturation protease